MLKKIISLLIAATCLVSLFVTPILAADTTESSGGLDYVGLISRRDKYDNYCNIGAGTLWSHKVFMRFYAGWLDDTTDIATYLDPSIRDLYYTADSERGSMKWKDDKTQNDFIEYYRTEAAKGGCPQSYYFVKYANISRDACEASLKKHAEAVGFKYGSWMCDGFYADDIRATIETYMSPEAVIDMDVYNSGAERYRYVDHGFNSEIGSAWDYVGFIKFPSQIIKMSLDVLDGWGYSDEYWYDYYSFVQYIGSCFEQSGDVNDSIGMNSCFKSDSPEYAELDRRLEIYAERVGKSPATGDDARRAVVAVGTAALAALIPAVIGFVELRRKKHMQ